MAKTLSLDGVRSLILKISKRENESLPPNAKLIEEGYLDSFAVIELVQILEERLNIVFEYDDLRRNYFKTAEGIYDLLSKKYGIKSNS
jgi:acyl carrier protein